MILKLNNILKIMQMKNKLKIIKTNFKNNPEIPQVKNKFLKKGNHYQIFKQMIMI